MSPWSGYGEEGQIYMPLFVVAGLGLIWCGVMLVGAEGPLPGYPGRLCCGPHYVVCAVRCVSAPPIIPSPFPLIWPLPSLPILAQGPEGPSLAL